VLGFVVSSFYQLRRGLAENLFFGLGVAVGQGRVHTLRIWRVTRRHLTPENRRVSELWPCANATYKREISSRLLKRACRRFTAKTYPYLHSRGGKHGRKHFPDHVAAIRAPFFTPRRANGHKNNQQLSLMENIFRGGVAELSGHC